MFKSYTLDVQLVGYDTIKSDKGEFLKIYLVNHRAVNDNQVGYSILELFEPAADWADIISQKEFKPGCNFHLEGYFSNYRFRVTKFGGFITDRRAAL